MILPLWNEKRYAPCKVAALVEVLYEQGIAPEASLSGSGLSPESLIQPGTLTSVRKYITVCHNALHLSKDPETPFSVGSRIPLSAYGMYGFALVCSPTIREYFQVAVKYHKLATPILTMSWREEKDCVSWALEKNPALLTGDGHLAPLRAIPRFIEMLHGAGVAGVVRPACGRCGRVVRIDKPMDGVRVCRTCIAHSRTEPCARCGAIREPVTRDGQGQPICASCFVTAPENLETCTCRRTDRCAEPGTGKRAEVAARWLVTQRDSWKPVALIG